jgi:solute carrier family 35 protein C2
MDFSIPTDRFKLDSLPLPHDRASRPTIPYSQFPRPTLPHVSTSFDHSSRLRGTESIPNVIVSGTSTSPHNIDSPMDSITPSGQRRRRSSLISSAEGGPYTQRADGMQDNHKWAEWPEDDGRGSADGGSGSEDLDSLLEEEGLNDDEETGLTEPERRRRKGKRRRNSLLDQRIIGHSNVTVEERQEANQHLLKRIAINCLLIGLWYVSPSPQLYSAERSPLTNI